MTVGTWGGDRTVVSHGAYGYNAFGCAPHTTRLRVGLGGLYSDEERRWRLTTPMGKGRTHWQFGTPQAKPEPASHT